MQLAQRVLWPVLDPVGRLTDALADPARRERTVLIVLAAFAVAWTIYGVIAKSSQGTQIDAAEIVAWSHHLALGYAKHPLPRRLIAKLTSSFLGFAGKPERYLIMIVPPAK